MNFHLVKFEMSCGLANQLPQSTLPEVVFAGRSNVGKSSLINKIFNQKQLARVSATPGKTATINFFRCGDVARFADLPGYDSEVIMAAGAFVQGSSIELSADGPIREPYAIYYQGGLTWAHAKLGILMSLQKMCDAGLITLPEA